MTQINDIRDLVRVLQEHPEWLHTIRGLLLSEDLQNLPARLAELTESVSSLDKKIDGVATDLREEMKGMATDLRSEMKGMATDLREEIRSVDTNLREEIRGVDTNLREEIKAVATDLNRLEGKVDNHYGAAYEFKVARHIQSIAGQHLGLVSVRVLYGGDAGMDPALNETLAGAAEQGNDAFERVNSLLACDLIVSGRRRGGQEQEYAVFEASVTVGNDDVNRAAERAAILAAITGATARGVAIGATLGSAQVDLALSSGVSAITYSE